MKRLARKGSITLLTVVLTGGLAFIALFLAGTGPFSAHANPGTHVGFDTVTADNSPTSLGAINACIEVSNGQSFYVDLYGTEIIDLRAFEAFIEFDDDLLTIDTNDVFQLLAFEPGSSVQDVSEPVPDTDGIFLSAAYDLGTPDSGSGVLARLGLVADPLNDGISDFHFFFTPNLTDVNLDPIPLSRVIDATIAVDTVLPNSDSDSFPDACDNCPTDDNPGQEDDDDDGVGNLCDNCPNTPNTDQADWDGNGVGDACDDYDLDGILDDQDNCRETPNPDQTNTDASDQDADTLLDEDPIDTSDNDGDTLVDEDPPGDALGDACDTDDDNDTLLDGADNCPLYSNPDQTDTDSDTLGDACDPDDDEDGFTDSTESSCGSDSLNSTSTCEVCDEIDNDGNDGIDEGFDLNPVNGVPDCSDPDADTDGDTIPNPTDDDDDDDADPDPGFNDGFLDSEENWMGTDAFDACPDDPSHQAWPPDFDGDTTVNVLDVLRFKPVLGSVLGGPDPKDRNFDRRYDLYVDTTINVLDVLKIKPHLGASCI